MAVGDTLETALVEDVCTVIFLSTSIPTSSSYNKPHILLTSLVVSSNFSVDSLSRYVLQISTNDKLATSTLIVYIYNFFFLSPG